MNTIKIFISCDENIQIRTHENTDVFITLSENIYDIHSKRVNILYLYTIFILSIQTPQLLYILVLKF